MPRKKSDEEKPDLYRILQVQPSADPEVIKAASRALVLKYHPDHGGNGEHFKEINLARKVLEDEKERTEYDAQLRKSCANMIGPYQLTRKISEGGFGRVYEGVHTLLGEKVCIKQNLRVSAEDTEMFVKEAKAIWELRHHALPAVRDMIELPDGSMTLVMSYIPGPTLEQVVKKYEAKNDHIDPESVCWIAERVLDALRYMHWHGVVHGDVKPANIIVQPETHTCALVDFGLCTIRPTSRSHAEGYTPLFASPESLGDGPLLPESDLYSLGLTMIYALGGDVKRKRIPSSIPAGIRDYVNDLVIYDVAERPHWDNIDLVQKLREVRLKEFGRSHSGLAELRL